MKTVQVWDAPTSLLPILHIHAVCERMCPTIFPVNIFLLLRRGGSLQQQPC